MADSKISYIEIEVNSLDEMMTDLYKSVETLEERLKPVLGIPENDPQCDTEATREGSQLAMDLNAIAYRGRELKKMLDKLTRTLEV